MNNNFSHKKGFSLFIALMIASALLMVSFIVSKISTKGLEFANTGKDSQIAFFAADAGIECALYWDVAPDPSTFSPSSSGPISCAGQLISNNGSIPGSSTPIKIGGSGVPAARFYFSLNSGPNPTNACVIVYVYKNGLSTHISSRGYNTCDPNSARRVERGVEVTY